MIYDPPSINGIQKTLDAKLLSGITASMTLNNVTGIQDKPGVCVVDLIDANEKFTPAKREYISFTGVSGNTLTGLTRNVDSGGSDQDHAVGAIVQFPADVLQQQALIDFIRVQHNDDGTHKSALVTTLKATGAEINTGTEDTKIVTPKAIADSTLIFTNSLAYQCIINGGFTVNQRVYVSNATLAAGVYGHDRWKAGADGGDYTFTQLAQATTITIKTGKSLIQVIEDKNVIGGTYTLSWTGTSKARFGINSATPSGAYAASPITITTQTAGTVMSVEFNEGTLGQVNLANSSVALPFMPKSEAQEKIDCQRYCQVYSTTGTYMTLGTGFAISDTALEIIFPFVSTMRTLPTLEATAGDWLAWDGVTITALTSITLKAAHISDKNTVIECQTASGLTKYRTYTLIAQNSAGKKITLSAEL